MERALISKELYLRLRDCRDRMETSGVPGWKYSEIRNLASVFVPVRPRPAMKVPFRLLVIGQATRSFSPTEPEMKTFETTTARCVEVAEGYIGRQLTGSSFWNWIRNLLITVYTSLDLEPTTERLLGSLGWSNLAKIGDVKGNPPVWTTTGQAELACEALNAEIAKMAPTFIVACIGPWGRKQGEPIFNRVFGEDESWQPRKVGHTTIGGVPTVLTDHPTTLSVERRRADVIAETADRILATINGK